jgi:aspartyl/asparaginyl-tRNA synthetase
LPREQLHKHQITHIFSSPPADLSLVANDGSHRPLPYKEEFLAIRFKEFVKMLKKRGYSQENGVRKNGKRKFS